MFGSREFLTLETISAVKCIEQVNEKCRRECIKLLDLRFSIEVQTHCKFNANFHFKVGKSRELNNAAS